jgi:adenosylcobinamide-phosphate guanylyltransferase
MVTALIMAGGEGTRMKSTGEKPVGEKPLIEIRGKPMIQYVIDAVLGADELEGVVVATSKHTLKTAEFVKKQGIKVLETPGQGYIEDLAFIIQISEWGNDEVVLTITADIPLVTGEIIDQVIKEYKKCGKPAMCVAVPVEIFRKHGLKPSILMGDIVPSGLNILRRSNKQQDEEVLSLGKIELALNINRPEDIILLEKLLSDEHYK